jgi:hypothetical protein
MQLHTFSKQSGIRCLSESDRDGKISVRDFAIETALTAAAMLFL